MECGTLSYTVKKAVIVNAKCSDTISRIVCAAISSKFSDLAGSSK